MPKTSFAWLARDAAAAFKRGDCDGARLIASEMSRQARTPKQRTAVLRVHKRTDRCVAMSPDLEGSRNRRRR